jgi:hypothetical protein
MNCPYLILAAVVAFNIGIVLMHIRHRREGRVPGQVRGPDGRWINLERERGDV